MPFMNADPVTSGCTDVLRDDLGPQFQRVRHPLARGTQPINRIHELKYCRFAAPWITREG